MEILEHQTLEMRNVLQFRAKLDQKGLVEKTNEIEAMLKQKAAKKIGPSASVTYSVEDGATGQILDVEILIPIDRKIDFPAGFNWIPNFKVADAVKLRHTGNPVTFQDEMDELKRFLAEKGYTNVGAAYHVTVKSATTMQELDGMIIDVYVDVSGQSH